MASFSACSSRSPRALTSRAGTVVSGTRPSAAEAVSDGRPGEAATIRQASNVDTRLSETAEKVAR